jgi:hypothetical protein
MARKDAIEARKEAGESEAVEEEGEAKGTGGSSLVPFLKQAKEETLEARVG